MIPVKADTPAMIPTPVGLAPKYEVNSGRTGLFEMVELNMANSPEKQSRRKGVTLDSIVSIYQDRERLSNHLPAASFLEFHAVYFSVPHCLWQFEEINSYFYIQITYAVKK
jgi:hypothetical protein